MFRSQLFAAPLVLAAVVATGVANAQDDGPPQTQCLRYLQVYERNLHIPQGLTTAISLAETGRPLGPQHQLLPWPWTININGQGHFFDTKEAAVAAARKLMDEGQRSIDVGCMQVNLRFHPNAFHTLEDAFDPAANVQYGAQFLVSLHQAQGSWEKAVERYHSSDDGRRNEYRDKVLALWNTDVRDLVMNAVTAENTDTPYHHAMQDFASGRYAEALSKYQNLVDANSKDRIGLLGLAMSYEQLGRTAEANDAYAKYVAVDPDNEAVLAKLIHEAKLLQPPQTFAKLETIAKSGVNNAELFEALTEAAAKTGNNEAALKYAEQAVNAAPSVIPYRLNAAIAADRLKRTTLAVRYYNDFLDMMDRQPGVIVQASLDGIRDRVQFLRAR
jgi:tetratricopeptide (TPR) repeat protein